MTLALSPSIRFFALYFVATNAWPTACGTVQPCYALTAGVTVLLAEAVEPYLAVPGERREWTLMPVRMKLRTLLYGKSPGDEFTWYASATREVRTGDVFYIEAATSKDFRFRPCGESGPYHEASHAPRVKYLRELSEGKHRESSLFIGVIDQQHRPLPGITVSLFGRSEVRNIQTNARGIADWKTLPSGRYRISATKDDYSLFDPEEALASIEIPIGGCLRREVTLKPLLPSPPIRNPNPK